MTPTHKIKRRKNKRKISRRKPGSKPGKNYFSQETQDAIVNFQTATEQKEREDLYVKEIMPAFDTLVENLINVYGFKVLYETKKDLKTECLEFLFTTLGKFNGKAGTKAFSYFNVVAKNWLTIRSKKNAKAVKTYISADDRDSFTEDDLRIFESHNIIPSYDEMLIAKESSSFVQNLTGELGKRVKSDNEKAVVAAIKQVIDNLENIDILNKRAVLLYLKEISGLSAKQLSTVLAQCKKHYKDIKKQEF